MLNKRVYFFINILNNNNNNNNNNNKSYLIQNSCQQTCSRFVKLVLMVVCLLISQSCFCSLLTQNTQAPNDMTLKLNTKQAYHNDFHWTYDQQSTWSQHYPHCTLSGLRQSSININTSLLAYSPIMQAEFSAYNNPVSLIARNSNHSASLRPVDELTAPSVVFKAPDFNEPRTYILQDIHFHWATPQSKGSEHSVDGQKYDAEMHLVHHAEGIEKEDLEKDFDSLLVIGVFLNRNNSALNIEQVDKLFNCLQMVSGSTNEVPCYQFDTSLDKILPQFQQYYHYKGSLTTPPCSEIVDWIVLQEPMQITSSELFVLENFYAANNQLIGANNRQPLPLASRIVYTSIKSQATTTTTSTSNRWRWLRKLSNKFAQVIKSGKAKILQD